MTRCSNDREGPSVRTKIRRHGGGEALRNTVLHRGHRGTENTESAEEWAQRNRERGTESAEEQRVWRRRGHVNIGREERRAAGCTPQRCAGRARFELNRRMGCDESGAPACRAF